MKRLRGSVRWKRYEGSFRAGNGDSGTASIAGSDPNGSEVERSVKQAMKWKVRNVQTGQR